MALSLPVPSRWDAPPRPKSAAATRGIPLIPLSAHALDGARDQALAAGCDDFETKPVDLARLLEKMQRLLGGAR
jgi:CheY-like chemotaxis protein